MERRAGDTWNLQELLGPGESEWDREAGAEHHWLPELEAKIFGNKWRCRVLLKHHDKSRFSVCVTGLLTTRLVLCGQRV